MSNQNVRGFSELHKLPSQQNQTFGTSCFRLAQESFFLTDWQSPYRVKGGLYRNLKKKKKKNLLCILNSSECLTLTWVNFRHNSSLTSLAICDGNKVLHQLMEMVGILFSYYMKKPFFFYHSEKVLHTFALST